ncbi:hypothetical protein HMPREF9439_00886 [Parasutterella excrementihominis YIT 11859]|uniref:Uncharacterized protein n=1 Tax=Parasutterella excrementihominis YIT 11859 TaxID=762966 RepID=F3QIY6_9BURK|nr:hypothetical protein HMPREF9439_00886 [Parasutterella excrementihominis YIT 11859]
MRGAAAGNTKGPRFHIGSLQKSCDLPPKKLLRLANLMIRRSFPDDI